MPRLTSIHELKGLRERIISEKKLERRKPGLVISDDTGAQASGVNDIIRLVKRYILERGLRDKLNLRITGCIGFCQMNPYIIVEPHGHFYPNVKMEHVPRIIKAALGGFIDEELIYRDSLDGKVYTAQQEIPFFKRQQRVILGNNQKLDPIRILDYIENGGYSALEKVLGSNDPGRVINEVKQSGLRGRGGAGFPTGLKWERARAATNGDAEKYLVCNADEGDPGAYMDRSVLEGNPHSIIEGILCGGFAIGASHGIVYVRAEYPLAIKHTLIALEQARTYGLLGTNILGSGFNFDIEIVRGAGAFVCGEETALIRSVEGFMGEPRQRPPYPIEKGIFGHPTCINNVETFANIPIIINRGGAEYAKIGTPNNSGTKIFSLVGKIRNTGLVEVPLGMKISEVVYDIGGGPSGKARIKGVQTGGPSGGCIPSRLFHLPIDYETLSQAGSIMGSGGMIVVDENTCMVDVAKYFMNFLMEESCGKCFTCRKGTQRMWEILDDVSKGEGDRSKLQLLEELATVVKDTSMCGLGQSASNPVLSTLRYFRQEYERHLIDKKCDAFVCKELVGAPCQSACPVGTEAWRYVAHIARGDYEAAYQALREANPFPSVCARVCDHPCEERCRAGQSGSDPVAIRALKRFITDRIDPSAYQPKRSSWSNENPPAIAVVGAGPAGLTAAHYLSLKGYQVTVFDSEKEPGGMLYCAIPAYRLPKETIRKEIDSLLDQNISLKCGQTLGKDITVDGLLGNGFSAVLLAMGAHKSKLLDLENENIPGIYPSIEFLKAFNLRNENWARGRVGVIGGGNSAIDAARTAVRQHTVDSVILLYRRTRHEMPAFTEEIEAAEQEGIRIETLIAPKRIIAKNGRLSGVECMRNELGDIDAGGRRKPVPVPGSEHVLEFDTLIVAISEDSGRDCISAAQEAGIETSASNTVKIDGRTLSTSRAGVFAAGDVTTGPNTVIQAIAAGKRAAVMIDRYVRGETLEAPAVKTLPEEYVAPVLMEQEGAGPVRRIETPRAPADWRKRNFAEVEVSLSVQEADYEARRCLRCDLEFTRAKTDAEKAVAGELAFSS